MANISPFVGNLGPNHVDEQDPLYVPGPNDVEQGAQGQDQLNPQDYTSEEELAQIMSEFWAAEKDSAKLWETLSAKEQDSYDAMARRNLPGMYRLVYGHYFGLGGVSPAMGTWQTQSLRYGGENGELIEFSLGEFRSFVDQIVGLVTKNRPTFRAQAINTDYNSLAQVESASILAQSIYEQSMGERREKVIEAREILYGKAYVIVDWDIDGGNPVEITETQEMPGAGPVPVKKKVRPGNFQVDLAYPWEVCCEPYRSETETHQWRIVRKQPISIWEACARWPVKARQIKESKGSGDTIYQAMMFPSQDPQAMFPDDMASVKVFYHAKTAALPEGRKATFVNDVLVEDKPLPIDVIPVAVWMSRELDGTSFGISDLWNLIPCEQMQNQVLSDIATNIESYGRPPIIMTEGTDVDLDALANGQSILFKPPGTDDPTTLKFPEVREISIKLLEMLKGFKQSLSGLNAIARGDTSNDSSGAYAALFDQKANDLQNPRIMDLNLNQEAIGNIQLQFLKKYAKYPQVVRIVGKDEADYLETFTADDLGGIQQVTVKIAPPELRSQSGRMQIVQMLQTFPGAISDPSQVLELLISGQMKPMYETSRTVNLAVKWENEQLMLGPEVQKTQDVDPNTGMPVEKQQVPTVPVYFTDNVSKHLEGHLQILYSPGARKNPKVRDAVMAHILHHLDVARNSDPYAAAVLSNPPPQAQLLGQGDPGQQNKPNKPTQATNAAVNKASQAVGDTGQNDKEASLPNLPSPAKPPGPTQG